MLTRPDIIQIRTPGVCCYALVSGGRVYLLDTGFLGGVGIIRRALAERNFQLSDIAGILLTHGHLDHCGNAARLIELSGAWSAGPRADLAHFQGDHPYRGRARMVGWMETLMARLAGVARITPGRGFEPNEEFPIWEGLVARPFPGHTAGHTVFYSQARKILFSGDLFLSFGAWSHLPPRLLNDDHEQMRVSFRRVAELDFEEVYPCHANRASPQEHARVLRRLLKNHQA